MTIAAGFCCQDGVVLSADTLMTASPSKTHESKVSRFDFDGGKVGFALAGNVAGALSAIDKVQKRLKTRKPKDAFAEIESTLEAEYTRQVLTDSFDYSLLIALWQRDRVRLYGTSGVSVFPVNSWEAIGIGSDLAKFIVLQGHAPSRIEQALKLSSYMLSSIKESVDGCGGMSIHLVFSNDGRDGLTTSLHPGPCKDLQDYARAFDLTVRELLMQVATEEATDEQVKQYINDTLANRLIEKRRQWAASRTERERSFAEVNPKLSEDDVRQFVRELSKGLLPSPPQLPSKTRPGSKRSPGPS